MERIFVKYHFISQCCFILFSSTYSSWIIKLVDKDQKKSMETDSVTDEDDDFPSQDRSRNLHLAYTNNNSENNVEKIKKKNLKSQSKRDDDSDDEYTKCRKKNGEAWLANHKRWWFCTKYKRKRRSLFPSS